MKRFNLRGFFQTAATMTIGLVCLVAKLDAQITAVPAQFTDWTGAINSDFFNPGNWSTGIVPNSTDAAIRLPGDPTIANKHIMLTYTGTGDKRIQFYSIQTGASKTYTVEFAGTEAGWLELNPVGKGFTFNGIIGNSMGSSYDITYPESTGNDTNRLAAYYILNSYSRLTLAGSSAAIRVAENGLSSGVFTLRGNAEMDLSAAGNLPFITASGTYNANRLARLQIGGLQTDPGTVIYVGTREVNLNSRMATGEVSVMGGLFYGDNTGNAECHVNGYITKMTGIVNFTGDGRASFQIRGGQYIVDGVHNSNVTVWSGAAAGGSGIINGSVTVNEGGLFTPGERSTAADTPLIVNASSFTLNGNLGFDLVTATVYDRLNLTITGTMSINSPANLLTPGKANLVVGMADSFPRMAGTYALMTVTSSGTGAAVVGDFADSNVSLPLSMSLKPSWSWDIVTNGGVEQKRTLLVSFEQLPFASPSDLSGKYLKVAQMVDDVFELGTVSDVLFDSLNRQPSIILYKDLLDQLSPSAYQSWFPAAIVRANLLVQNLEDRMYQDAAFKRKKHSIQLSLDGYRQESSSAKKPEAAYSNYDTIGSVVGIDYALTEDLIAGGFVGYDKTDIDLDATGGTCDVVSYTMGLKARFNKGDFQVNLIGFYGTDKYSSSRTVALTNLGAWADGDTDGTRLGAAFSLGYKLNTSLFELMPVVGVQWLNWKADAFQEQNASEANLYVYEQSEKSLQGKLGARIARSFTTKHGAIRPFFSYTWLHEFKSDTRTLSADLFGSRLDIDAPGSNASGYRLDLGLDWSATSKLRVELRYHSEYRSAVKESVGLSGGVNYTF